MMMMMRSDETFDGVVHTNEFSCRGTNGDLREFFLLEVIQFEPSDVSKLKPNLVKKVKLSCRLIDEFLPLENKEFACSELLNAGGCSTTSEIPSLVVQLLSCDSSLPL